MADVIPFPQRASKPQSESQPGPLTEGPTHAEPATTMRDAIGRVLRAERADQERTLADVASDANMSLPYLSEVERGRKEVSSDLLSSICDALDIEVADALEEAARHMRPISTPVMSGNRFETLLLAA